MKTGSKYIRPKWYHWIIAAWILTIIVTENEQDIHSYDAMIEAKESKEYYYSRPEIQKRLFNRDYGTYTDTVIIPQDLQDANDVYDAVQHYFD